MISPEFTLIAAVALGVWGPAIVLGLLWGTIRFAKNKLETRRHKKMRETLMRSRR